MPSSRETLRDISAMRTCRLIWRDEATVKRLSAVCFSVRKARASLIARSASTGVATWPLTASPEGRVSIRTLLPGIARAMVAEASAALYAEGRTVS
jgi:hypothetical protein